MTEKESSYLRRIELLRERVPGWERYPFNIPSIASMNSVAFHPRVTFFVGENGTGKSTLVEAIAAMVGVSLEGGTKNFKGSSKGADSDLYPFLRLVRNSKRERSSFFLRAETMFNVFSEAENYWPSVRLHKMSHGEAFLWVAMHRLENGGLYLFDEPESALSPQRQIAFLVRMEQLVRGGAQLIIATHSPILMAYPKAWIYSFDGGEISKVKYEDTEHFNVTRAFLDDPTTFLSRLLKDA